MSEQWHCHQLFATERDGPVVVCEREDLMKLTADLRRLVIELGKENDELWADVKNLEAYNKKLRDSLLQAGVPWQKIPAFWQTVEEMEATNKESK